MSFLGSDFNFKPGWKPGPRWKQCWWWRERIPGIVAAVVLATLMGLAAWLPFYFNDRGDDHVARPSDTSNGEPRTSAPSETPRPTEQPPELPEAAHKPTVEGIKATIRFEIDAINYAQRTRDFAPVKKVYSDSCGYCELIVKRLSANLQNSNTYVDAEYVIKNIKPMTSVGEKSEIIGYANILETQPKEALLVDSNGKELKKRPIDAEIKSLYTLGFIGNQWFIQKVS